MGAGSTIKSGGVRYVNDYTPSKPILKTKPTSNPLRCNKCSDTILSGDTHYKLGKKILCKKCKP